MYSSSCNSHLFGFNLAPLLTLLVSGIPKSGWDANISYINVEREKKKRKKSNNSQKRKERQKDFKRKIIVIRARARLVKPYRLLFHIELNIRCMEPTIVNTL